MVFLKNLASSVKRLCKTYHLTQERAAERCQISSRHLNYILHGKITPSITVLEKICMGFEITPNELLLSQENDEELYKPRSVIHVYWDQGKSNSKSIPVCPTCKFVLANETLSVCLHCGQPLNWNY